MPMRIAPLGTSSMASIACEEVTTAQPGGQKPSHAATTAVSCRSLDQARAPSAVVGETVNPRRRLSVLGSLQKHQAQLQLREEACEIRLPQLAFAICWMSVLLVHSVLAVFYFYVVRLHWYLQLSKMEYFVEYLSADLYNFFDAIIVANWILWTCHIYTIACAIGCSLYYRQLVFRRHRSLQGLNLKVTPTNNWACFGQLKGLERLYEALAGSFTGAKICFVVVCGRKGFFGVEGRHFGKVFLLRELVEIVLQTYQAWKLSHYVSSIWVNRTFVIIIIVNCWSTPLIHHLFRNERHESFKKVGCLLLDTFLDIFSSVVVPLVIFLPYAKQFDVAHGDFPLLSYYKDTWFINAIAENRQVFTLSWIDFISKTFPGYTILSTLRSIKASLPPPARQTKVDPRLTTATQAEASSGAHSLPSSGTHGLPDTERKTTSSRIKKSVINFVRPQWRREGKRMELLLILWGIGVALVHIYSSSVAWTGGTSSCLLEMRPWATTKYSCIVVEINCVFVKNFTGHTADIDQALVGMEPTLLKSLIFSCCPELQMPPQVQQFSALETIKIYNSTINQWDESAALMASIHPVMQFVYMVDTNLSGIPDGLLSRDFPPSLLDVEFCGSNLTTLPEDLYDFWPNVDYFVLENSPGVQIVPEALRRMRIRHLSLCSNSISVIPEYFFFGNQSVQALELAGNPISNLPERGESIVSEPTMLYSVSLGYTNVSELPVWMKQLSAEPLSDVLLTISAGETPYCRDAVSTETKGRKVNDFVVADCTVSQDLPIKLLYPAEAEREWRKSTWSSTN